MSDQFLYEAKAGRDLRGVHAWYYQDCVDHALNWLTWQFNHPHLGRRNRMHDYAMVEYRNAALWAVKLPLTGETQ